MRVELLVTRGRLSSIWRRVDSQAELWGSEKLPTAVLIATERRRSHSGLTNPVLSSGLSAPSAWSPSPRSELLAGARAFAPRKQRLDLREKGEGLLNGPQLRPLAAKNKSSPAPLLDRLAHHPLALCAPRLSRTTTYFFLAGSERAGAPRPARRRRRLLRPQTPCWWRCSLLPPPPRTAAPCTAPCQRSSCS